MTIKELYQWALEHHYEDYNIKIYDDYSPDGLNPITDLTIDENNKEVIVWTG